MRAEAYKLSGRPFEVMTNQISEKAVLDFMKDERLMLRLAAAKWPTDEATCTEIGKRCNLEGDVVAAVSKYQRAILAEGEGIKKLH